MSTRLTAERLAEIRAGRREYRTTEQLDRDVAALLDDREALLAERTGKGTATTGGELTPAPASGRAPRAELQFAVWGTVPLLGASLCDLDPDWYGHTYRQIGGWLPDMVGVELPHGTERLEHAHYPGHVMPCEINVQVNTRPTPDGGRYMTVEWRREVPR
ncbi:hypothetical protein [Streptomyces sp. NPDC094032]|uniref:hypothetical protein n=1 Tax=Streptomyces sp. NPDC094032 TaxID=3155308 RepID=UPI003321F711